MTCLKIKRKKRNDMSGICFKIFQGGKKAIEIDNKVWQQP